MWDNLIVYHSNESASAVQLPMFYSWKTCQRSIIIGDSRLSQTPNAPLRFEIFKGYKAYGFLLEVITGLRSSLFAETEVLHQFKLHFEKKNLPGAPFGEYLLKLRNDLLTDARYLRREHLMNLGDQSYGGIAHRLLPDKKTVLLLGSGQLSEKIIPFLKKGGRKVVLAARNQERREYLAIKNKIESIDLNAVNSKRYPCLVIAAPIDVNELDLNLATDSVIVDLRSEDQMENMENFRSYHCFANILTTLDKTRDRHQILYKKLQHVIEDLIDTRRMARFEFVNGWEDIPCLTG